VSIVARLAGEGLTRHEEIHAVASATAEHFFDIMTTATNDDSTTTQARYRPAIERLTAMSSDGG